MNIEKFKQEHVEILADVAELRKLVQAGVNENAAKIADKLGAMKNHITRHLASEDVLLYPAFAKSSDQAVAKTGKNFQNEMGGISAAYMEFARKWAGAPRLLANPDGFRQDANNIFKALHERIQKENQELYTLAEKLQ